LEETIEFYGFRGNIIFPDQVTLFSLGFENKSKDKNQVFKNFFEELKENGYINDNNYIDRAVQEFIALKNMSIREIKYKLFAKGLSHDIIDEYISNHTEDLTGYEIQSAKNIFYKKRSMMEIEEIKQFLLKKGYRIENIREALSEVE